MAVSEKASGRLRLNVTGVWTVKEWVSFFDRLRDAYAMLLPFIPSAEVLKAWHEKKLVDGYLFPWPGTEVRKPDQKLFTLSDLAFQTLLRDPASMPKVFSDRLAPFDELTIDAVSISSPGWIDVVGRLNPLQAIHEIIVLIRDWKQTKERGRIENSILQMEGIRQRIQILREAGFADAEIQSQVRLWLTPPTHFLIEVVQQRGQVTSSACTPLPIEGPTSSPPPTPSPPASPSPSA